MTSSIFWGLIDALLGAGIALFGIYIAQSNGFLLYWVAKQEHDLNLRKATPVIDSTVRIISRQINPAPIYDPFYYVVVSIHNHGDLAAQELNGYWRVHSPNKTIQEHTVPIRIKALGSAPYEYEPWQLSIDNLIHLRNPTVSFCVDIDFDYIGIPTDAPQHYSASWQYDSKGRQMIQT